MDDLDAIRVTLTHWGEWWRQNGNHIGYPRVNQICRMMHEAKLGCRIQNTIRHGHSEEMRVPGHIERVDTVVSGLGQRDRMVLVALYQRAPRWSRKALQRKSPEVYRALLRAELRVSFELRGGSEQSPGTWSPPSQESIPPHA